MRRINGGTLKDKQEHSIYAADEAMVLSMRLFALDAVAVVVGKTACRRLQVGTMYMLV